MARISTMDEKAQYWFNTKTGLVEEGHKSLAMNRIGPFATAEEAANALLLIAERTKAQLEQEELED